MLTTNTHTNIYKQAEQFGTKENEINDFVLINALCIYTYILLASGKTAKVTVIKY